MPKSKCKVPNCEWESPDTWRHIAGCFATWHVYEDHNDLWRMTFGDRPPVDADPRTKEGMTVAIIESALSSYGD